MIAPCDRALEICAQRPELASEVAEPGADLLPESAETKRICQFGPKSCSENCRFCGIPFNCDSTRLACRYGLS
jgi:hypothetical protein